MQSSFFAPDTDWAPPSSLPSLVSYDEVAIDLETYDPLLMSHGPSWAFKDKGYVTMAKLFYHPLSDYTLI